MPGAARLIRISCICNSLRTRRMYCDSVPDWNKRSLLVVFRDDVRRRLYPVRMLIVDFLRSPSATRLLVSAVRWPHKDPFSRDRTGACHSRPQLCSCWRAKLVFITLVSHPYRSCVRTKRADIDLADSDASLAAHLHTVLIASYCKEC